MIQSVSKCNICGYLRPDTVKYIYFFFGWGGGGGNWAKKTEYS